MVENNNDNNRRFLFSAVKFCIPGESLKKQIWHITALQIIAIKKYLE